MRHAVRAHIRVGLVFGEPEGIVTLLPSVFEGRPPVMLFSYPKACGAHQRPMSGSAKRGPRKGALT